MATDRRDYLLEKSEVEEQPFHSDVPLLGPLIARFREMWNNVAARWYVRALIQQQNRFNRLVVERIEEQDTRLVEQDREQTALVRDVAELTSQVAQANYLLATIEERMTRLEALLQDQEQEQE